MEDRETMILGPDVGGDDRLESWKEIASYLQRDVRTVIRWEKREGLPVRRHLHHSRSSVYAYRSELDSWRANRDPGIEKPMADRGARQLFRVACASLILLLTLFTTGNGGRAHIGEEAAPDGSGITSRVVWKDAMDGFSGAPSPDGRSLSFLDWMTGNLAVWDIESQTRELLTEDGSWEEPMKMSYSSVWSPDGKRIAFHWEISEQGKREHEVRIVSREGRDPRVLLRGVEANTIEVCDWSPDAEKILIQIGADGASPSLTTNQLALIRVEDGTLDPLRSGSGFSNAFFSADGRYVVYSRPPVGERFEADIFLLDLRRRTETCLVEHPAHDSVMGWVPESNHVLFASDRTGTNSLWSLAVVDGRPEGAPTLLKRDVGRILPLGFARDGSFFHSVMKAARDVMTMEIDPRTGTVVRPPEKFILKYEGSNQGSSYSPDGRSLAYLTKRGGVFPGTNVGNALCVRALDTGEEQMFFEEFRKYGIRYLRGPRWYPESDRILVAGWADRVGLYQVDLVDRTVQQVLDLPEGAGFTGHAIGPDGDSLFYTFRNAEGSALTRRQLSSSIEKELLGNRGGLTMSLSFDGRWLAFSTSGEERTLQVMPSSGGEARLLHRFEPKGYGVSHTWSPDGKYIFFTGRDKVGNERSLCRIAIEGGTVQELIPEILGLGSITVHPDGRHIAFESATDLDTATDVWVMKDYLPNR
jgi:Tol biopolymer transport system component